jgi:hypothetical protein
VAVKPRQAKPSQVWIDPGQQACRLARTVEPDGEMSTSHCWIGQDVTDVTRGIFWRLRISMKEPECVSGSINCPRVHLSASAAGSVYDSDSTPTDNILSAVFTSPVHNDYLDPAA